MSEVVTGILKLTFGFISKKARSYGAEKLQDGGLTNQKFRGWIVHELDDIKFKLDGLSHRELFASVSSFQLGVTRLNMCFGESNESKDLSSFELSKNEKHSQDTANAGASTSTQTKSAQKSVAIDDAVALANAVEKLKIESDKRFASAGESFKDAQREAKLAFHNAALSTDERILASKVRIASGILEHLDDPEFAANDCLQYLQELHDLPAIQDIFSVHIKAGIKSWIKSGFKKDSRAEIVETVTMINLILADFISKFTKRRMAVLDWPLIKCGKRALHPIHYKNDRLPNLKEKKITPPWDIFSDLYFHSRAFNSKGNLFFFSFGTSRLQKLDKTGPRQPCFTFPSSLYHSIRSANNLAVDEDDAVYVLVGDKDDGYRLSVYSADPFTVSHCNRGTLEFLKGVEDYRIEMTLTKDKIIVICFQKELRGDTHVYLCDNNGKLTNSFVTKGVLNSVFVSCNNELLIVTSSLSFSLNHLYTLHIYTKDRVLQRTVTLRTSQDCFMLMEFVYNEVTKNIIGFSTFYFAKLLVEFFSDETGELLCSYVVHDSNMPEVLYAYKLSCLKSGELALVGDKQVISLQSPSVWN